MANAPHFMRSHKPATFYVSIAQFAPVRGLVFVAHSDYPDPLPGDIAVVSGTPVRLRLIARSSECYGRAFACEVIQGRFPQGKSLLRLWAAVKPQSITRNAAESAPSVLSIRQRIHALTLELESEIERQVEGLRSFFVEIDALHLGAKEQLSRHATRLEPPPHVAAFIRAAEKGVNYGVPFRFHAASEDCAILSHPGHMAWEGVGSYSYYGPVWYLVNTKVHQDYTGSSRLAKASIARLDANKGQKMNAKTKRSWLAIMDSNPEPATQ